MKIINNYTFLTFTFLNSNLIEVKDVISDYFKEPIENKKYELQFKEFVLDDFYYDSPPKGGGHLKKVAFFNPKICSAKLIMFSNSGDGWITLANFISSQLNCEHITFYLTIKDNNDTQNMFVYRNAQEEERVVYTMMEENKWVFYQDGKIQNFENLEFYKKRQIKDRLNFGILVDYCNKLGLNITNDDFWKSDKDALYLNETILNRG